MMNNGSQPTSRRRARTDLIVICGSAVALFAISAVVQPLDHAARWVADYYSSKFDDIGTILLLAIIGTVVFASRRWRDIQAEIRRRETAEEHGKQSDRAYLQIVEQADEMIYRTDAQGRFQCCNPAMSRIFGYPETELIGTHFLKVIDPGESKSVAVFYKQQFEQRVPKTYHEFNVLTRDGDKRLVGQTVQLLTEEGKVAGFQAVAQDLTERRRIEEAKQQVTEYRNLFRLAADPILIFDAADGAVLEVNDKACRVYQIPREEFLKKRLVDFTLDPVKASARFEKVRAGEEIGEFEATHKRADGTEIQFLVNTKRIEYHGRKAVLSINRDITQRKAIEVEQRRLQSERDQLLEQLQLQAEVMPLAFIVCDTNYQTTFWNAAAEKIFGYSKEEIIGTPSHKRLVPAESQPFVEQIFERIAGGEILSSSFSDNVTKDGRQIVCEWYAAPLKKPDGTFIGIMSMAHDVTEQRRVEAERRLQAEQLRQAQKMEAVGQLAGGIAHDFNNLLTAINGYSDMSLRGLEPETPLFRNLQEIKKAGLRAASLTSQLLAFSRKQVMQPKVLDLNEVVADMDKMLRRLIGEDIDLVASPAKALGTVRADPSQIEQLILNLVLNARDAMPQGGKITIETANVNLDANYAASHLAVKPGPYVRLSVTDTGNGISPEDQKLIFEPFFTTKEVGKGTGLGLSTVYGIVQQNNGSIWVYSELNHGTTFKIYLPRIDEQAVVDDAEQTARDNRGNETILLVEDEQMVRDLATAILREYGYTVLTAANGLEGLRICEDSTQAIDVMVTDVVMPEMSGRQLAEAAAQLRPDMRVIYMSGYTDDSVVRHGVLEGDATFIQKPFLPDALASAVRDVLTH